MAVDPSGFVLPLLEKFPSGSFFAIVYFYQDEDAEDLYGVFSETFVEPVEVSGLVATEFRKLVIQSLLVMADNQVLDPVGVYGVVTVADNLNTAAKLTNVVRDTLIANRLVPLFGVASDRRTWFNVRNRESGSVS